MTAALWRTADRLEALAGWRALAAAILAGAASALAFPPLDIFPVFLIALGILVFLLDGAAARPRPLWRATQIGWGFGVGQFATGMHWIFYPFLVDPLEHGWQIPFALVLFHGGLALFIAGACAAAMVFWRKGPSRILLLAACYGLAEWLRGHVFTGLPWNLPAYGWGASLAVMQSMSVIGAYGLSLLTVLFGASLAEVARRRWLLPLVCAALFAGLWTFGAIRLARTPTEFSNAVRLRLVQPNVPQDEKYRRDLVARNWYSLMALSSRASDPPPTVIIWPEAAPPVLLQRTQDALTQIAELTGGKRTLITGNQRIEFNPDGDRRVFNSLYVFAPDGHIATTYDKFHLVPFGEYLPLESLLSQFGITKLTGMPGSFASGDGPHTVKVPGAPDAGPLICYEILFPGAVTDPKSRPGWLVNVTDDSWFGPWAGPRQHLLAARARAIEEGLPIARAANTGISAVIDPEGRIISQLGLDETGVVDARLPESLSDTIYARLGDLGFGLLLVLCTGFSWALARRPQAS